jgi:MoaA/NifB/PqqE/SkfB family radical SAM enzyme
VESKPFMIKSVTQQVENNSEDKKSTVIKFRKTAVNIDGEDRIIIMIRDLSDSVNVENLKLEQKEDIARQDLVT